jgi:hypothetical protein
MGRPKHQVTSGEDLFVGIDLHKHRWHVTIRTFYVKVFSASIPRTWEALQRILARYAGHQLKAELRFYGIRPEEPRGRWTQIHLFTLRRLRFGNRWMQESFNRLGAGQSMLCRMEI